MEKMKMHSLIILGFLTAAATPALAYENFIPLGAGYSPNVSAVPEFDSADGKKIARSDSYETDIYVKMRKKIEDESRLRQFFSDRNSTGLDGHIDY
jgi:hypothetical protein